MVRIPLPTASFSPSFNPDSTGDLPDADSESVVIGCKKAKNIENFSTTTAGIAKHFQAHVVMERSYLHMYMKLVLPG